MPRYIIDTDNPDPSAVEAVKAWLKRRGMKPAQMRKVRPSSGYQYHLTADCKITLCGYRMSNAWRGKPHTNRLRRCCPNCLEVAAEQGLPTDVPWAERSEITGAQRPR